MTTRKLPTTYTALIPLALMPAVGWQAVYHNDAGQHFVIPIHALVLVEAEQRSIQTGEAVEAPDTEYRDIMAYEYTPCDGWTNVQDDTNCCGLLPPDWTLADFEANKHCHTTPIAKEVDVKPEEGGSTCP